MFCAGCGFAGDLVELYASVSQQTFEAAVADFQLENILFFGNDEKDPYVDSRRRSREAQALWREAQERLSGGATSSVKAIFQDLVCWEHDTSLAALSKGIGILRAEDIDEYDLRKEDRRVLKRLGRYNALAMPVWELSYLIGFYLIQPASDLHNGCEYIQFDFYRNPVHALCGAQLLRMGQEHAVFTNDARVAVRFMARQSGDTGGITPFCVPVGPHEPYDHLSTQRVVYLPCDGPGLNQFEFIKRGARVRGRDVVEPWELSYSPINQFPRLTARAMVKQLCDKAAPGPKALGSFLLRQKEAEAVRMVNTMMPSTIERNAVLNYFQGDDAAELERLLDRTPGVRWIEFDGTRIQEDGQGWTVAGKVICSAVVRISEQLTNEQTGEVILIGTVAFNNRCISFREEKSKLRAGFVLWLDNLLARNNGWLMHAAPWAKKLLDVAYQFSKDNLRKTAGARNYGWDDKKTLFTRRFTLDHRGYTRVALDINGPEIAVPAELSDSEWEAFGDQGFCLTALALLGNLVRTANGHSGYGLLLPAARHLVDRIGDAIGLKVEENPSRARIAENARLPLPVVSQWNDDNLAELLRVSGPKHVLASVDQRTFDLLAVDPTWIRLPVGSIADYAALRWIWLVLPGLLTWSPPDGAFYTELARQLAPDVARHRPRHLLMSAASQLDARRIADGTRGTIVMTFLRRLVEMGMLKAVMDGDTVRILHSDVRAATTSALLPPADIKRMTSQLEEGSMLLESAPGAWGLSRLVWNMVGAYSRGD